MFEALDDDDEETVDVSQITPVGTNTMSMIEVRLRYKVWTNPLTLAAVFLTRGGLACAQVFYNISRPYMRSMTLREKEWTILSSLTLRRGVNPIIIRHLISKVTMVDIKP